MKLSDFVDAAVFGALMSPFPLSFGTQPIKKRSKGPRVWWVGLLVVS